MNRRKTGVLGLALAAVAVVGCSSDETVAGDDHDPVSVTFSVDGAPPGGDGKLHLPEGQTVTVRATFLNAGGDNLDDVEDTHFSSLTFNPAGIATPTIDPNAHFSHQVVVNATAATTGTVTVGFGHDAAADEHSLGPIDVVVE
ncbi:MAG TPA: hypothetical protein VLB12_12660 [Gemmatimonadales bacterium]|nr:hypothetical protein [Gemmatimonadales bacterium]HSE67829.1 hypothetical protein [Gemmatimonadales bacterium]